MQTALSTNLTSHLQSTEVFELQRRRHELVSQCEYCLQLTGRIRAKLGRLGNSPVDPNIAEHIDHLQQQLLNSQAACVAAETALREFNEANLSEEDLAGLSKEKLGKQDLT